MKHCSLSLLCFTLSACPGSDAPADDSAGSCADAYHCAERCNGIDDDGDGSVDEGDALDAPTWYTDVDGDGWGDDASATVGCTRPAGAVGLGGDCDDTDPAVHPMAAEQCDGVDQDCDGELDEDPIHATVYYLDADGDGHGQIDSDDWRECAPSRKLCQPMDGWALTPDDCDDDDETVHPEAEEVCGDGVDQDCDGEDQECGP
jgi:hypothetical protein